MEWWIHHVEEFIQGTFAKYSSNNGDLCFLLTTSITNKFEAYLHFSHEKSSFSILSKFSTNAFSRTIFFWNIVLNINLWCWYNILICILVIIKYILESGMVNTSQKKSLSREHVRNTLMTMVICVYINYHNHK